MAEPLFLVTGAILSACCRFEISVQDLKKIVRISINFCIPEFDQITIEKSNLLENRCKIRVIRGPACSKCDQNFGSCIFSDSDHQNCPIWCSTDAPGTLSGHPRIVPGTLQAVPGHYLGALGLPRRVPGPTSGRFWVPRGSKLLQILSKSSKSRSTFRSPELIKCRSRFCSK